jgi:hypothetical protein
VTRWRPLSDPHDLFMAHARFFSATRGLRASDEFFLNMEPGSTANRPISVSIDRKSPGNGADLKGPDRARNGASGTIMMNGG